MHSEVSQPSLFLCFFVVVKCELLTQTPGGAGTLIFSYLGSFNQILGRGPKFQKRV